MTGSQQNTGIVNWMLPWLKRGVEVEAWRSSRSGSGDADRRAACSGTSQNLDCSGTRAGQQAGEGTEITALPVLQHNRKGMARLRRRNREELRWMLFLCVFQSGTSPFYRHESAINPKPTDCLNFRIRPLEFLPRTPPPAATTCASLSTGEFVRQSWYRWWDGLHFVSIKRTRIQSG